MAGRCLLDERTLAEAGIGSVHALLDEESRPGEALESPGPLLEQIGARIARDELASR